MFNRVCICSFVKVNSPLVSYMDQNFVRGKGFFAVCLCVVQCVVF